MRTLSAFAPFFVSLAVALGTGAHTVLRTLARLLTRWIELVGQQPSLSRDPGWLAFHAIEHRAERAAEAKRDARRARMEDAREEDARRTRFADKPCVQMGVGL